MSSPGFLTLSDVWNDLKTYTSSSPYASHPVTVFIAGCALKLLITELVGNGLGGIITVLAGGLTLFYVYQMRNDQRATTNALGSESTSIRQSLTDLQKANNAPPSSAKAPQTILSSSSAQLNLSSLSDKEIRKLKDSPLYSTMDFIKEVDAKVPDRWRRKRTGERRLYTGRRKGRGKAPAEEAQDAKTTEATDVVDSSTK